jgi:hypothetical protein
MASPYIPPATAEVTALTDNRGTIQGTVPRGGSTDDQNLTISGTLSRRLYAGETIRIYDKGSYLGNASVILSPVAGPVRWTFEDPRIWILVYPLPLYFFSFTARVANVFGRLSAPGVAYTATLDQGGPASDTLSLLLRNFTDSGSSSSDRITNDRNFSLTLSGQEAGSTIAYQFSTNGGSTWNATTASQSNLTDGTYQFRALVTDLAGNTATSNSQSVTVDTVAAAGTLSLISFTDSGSSSTDRITNDRDFTLTLSGQEAGSAVTYQFSTNGGSTWKATSASRRLADGTYQFRAIVTDLAGNTATSNSQSVTVDATAPAAGTLSLGADFTDSGSSSSDRITNDRNFSLTLSGQEAGSTVAYQFSTNGGSTWNATTASQSNLTDGTYQFRALVTDLAGNTATSNSQSVTVDTVAAAGTLSLIGFTDSGSSSTDRITNDRNFSLTLSGQEAGSAVTYQVSTNGGSTWNATTASQSNLTDGTYQFRALVTDLAGNTATSNSQSVTVDYTAPATTAAITNITDNIGPLGTLAANALTDDPTPTISGTLSAALASGDSLHVYNGTTFLGSASVTNTTWSFTPSALANGFYAVTARVADAAGNLGAASMRQRFSLDATANQVIGDANNNILNASSAKDVLTGYVGADTFSFATPSTSTLASFDRITDFNIGTDLLDGPTAVTAANINKLGAVSGLNATSIGNLLTSASFLANRAATFTYADPSGISRRFIALNDGYAGFNASSDGIVEITGYTRLIANLAVI